MVTIDEAKVMLDEIAESLPGEFYKELNGGILLLEDVRRSPYDKAGDLYQLGAYCRSSSMGNHIEIYYGSFRRLYPNCTREEMREHLRQVLLHEFTHHMEARAGERGLEIKDEQQIKAYLEMHEDRK